jgi:hypothetical protein
LPTLTELIQHRRKHADRLANQNGAAGEDHVLTDSSVYLPRPTGSHLANILLVLARAGTVIKKSSFDAIALPEGVTIDFSDIQSIEQHLEKLTFIEIKTATQSRLKDDFSGFFFAFTEGEILAAEALGERHKVLLVNKTTGNSLMTSVSEILARSKSQTWQVSVQL